MAEIVVLNSGQKIQGDIILQNEEVLIIKKKDGTRYQYPRSEVKAILEESSVTTATSQATPTEHTGNKSVALRLQVNGGATYLPQKGWGGQIGADLLIGTKEIAGTPILVGGSFGYRAKLFNQSHYSFIPLQAVVSMPLTKSKHAPLLGLSMGYGFSTNKTTKGGICLSATAGWSYRINNNTSFILSAFAEWQQAQTEISEIINDQHYTNNIGCNFITIGSMIAIQF